MSSVPWPAMAETTTHFDGVRLCWEAFGASTDRTVLLIAGGAQSMVWWETGFCRLLAAEGFRVVRYDHRDTGRSSSSPAGRPSYSGSDLAEDPLRVLDAAGAESAHVIGLSMGGGIAQRLALTDPRRVRSLGLFSASPAAPGESDGLPPPTSVVAESFADPEPEPDWSDRQAVIHYRVAIERPYAGRSGFDEDRVRQLAIAEVDRTADMAASVTNHFLVESSWPEGVGLAAISAPTLIVHGTDDPLFPLPHAHALRSAIDGARQLELPGLGHQQPPPERWSETVAAVAANAART